MLPPERTWVTSVEVDDELVAALDGAANPAMILGMIFGCVGPLFNSLVLRTQDMFQRIHGGNTKKWVLIGGLIGGMCGVLDRLASGRALIERRA